MAEMTKVASSNIDSIGYENGKLYVKFTNGTLYAAETDESVYHDFMAAKSKGSHFAKELRKSYEFKKES